MIPDDILTQAEYNCPEDGMLDAACGCERGTRLNRVPADTVNAMNARGGCLSCGHPYRVVLSIIKPKAVA